MIIETLELLKNIVPWISSSRVPSKKHLKNIQNFSWTNMLEDCLTWKCKDKRWFLFLFTAHVCDCALKQEEEGGALTEGA